MILQIIIGALNFIFIIVQLASTKCMKVRKLNSCLKFLYIKIAFILLAALAYLITCCVILAAANKIEEKEVLYYYDKKCFVDYL